MRYTTVFDSTEHAKNKVLGSTGALKIQYISLLNTPIDCEKLVQVKREPDTDTNHFVCCLVGRTAINGIMKYDRRQKLTYTFIYNVYILCSKMLMSSCSMDCRSHLWSPVPQDHYRTMENETQPDLINSRFLWISLKNTPIYWCEWRTRY